MVSSLSKTSSPRVLIFSFNTLLLNNSIPVSKPLIDAYNVWKETYGQSWGPNPPSFEVWWEWMLAGGYYGYEYGDYTYRWVPVGDIIPLLILVLLYTLVMYLRPKFFQRVNNKN